MLHTKFRLMRPSDFRGEDGCQAMAKAHIVFGKGELKRHLNVSNVNNYNCCVLLFDKLMYHKFCHTPKDIV